VEKLAEGRAEDLGGAGSLFFLPRLIEQAAECGRWRGRNEVKAATGRARAGGRWSEASHGDLADIEPFQLVMVKIVSAVQATPLLAANFSTLAPVPRSITESAVRARVPSRSLRPAAEQLSRW
jgi:hypothetical protein